MSNFKMYDKVLYLGEHNTYECIYVCKHDDDRSVIETPSDTWLLNRGRDGVDIPEDYKNSLSDRYLLVDNSALMLSTTKEEEKIFERLYIKFEEGNQESLDIACKEAERLGYRRWRHPNALDFKGQGILLLYNDGEYSINICSKEESIIRDGHKEHKIEEPVKEDDGVWRYKTGIEMSIGGGLIGAEYDNYKKLLGLEDTQHKTIERRADGELVRETKKEPCIQSPYLYLFS